MSLPFAWLIAAVVYALYAVLWMRHRSVGQVRVWLGGLRWVIIGMAVVMLVGSLGARLLNVFSFLRPAPTDEERELFQGVEYVREVRSDPPMVIHVVRIDLNAPGIDFLVTPPDASRGLEVRGQTTSAFLAEHDLQLAINGDFFDPWWGLSILDYYPYPGDPVDLLGFAASEGVVYSDVRADHSTVFLYEDNRVSFDERIAPVYNAISGGSIIVRGGVAENIMGHPYLEHTHPRTAVGLDESGTTLILVVIDGRQPGYSEGASMPELADILIGQGAYTALNLDGGGSSALVMEGESGQPLLLNAPIHGNLPYNERPIANHLGVYALPLD